MQVARGTQFEAARVFDLHVRRLTGTKLELAFKRVIFHKFPLNPWF